MKPILTSLAAAGLLAACEEEQHAEAPAPRPVLTVVVAPQTARTVGFAGTVEPRYKSDLGFRVLGRIISRDVNVGEVVKKGQRLATLDPVAYQLAVRSAQADLASATARLENAAATETRQRTLLEKNVANQAQFEAAEQARESAEAGVTRAKANLDKAEEQLGYTELRATSTVSSPLSRQNPGRWSSRDKRSSRWPARTSARRWSTCPRASGGISGRKPASTSPCNSIPRCGLPDRCGRSLRRRIPPPARGG